MIHSLRALIIDAPGSRAVESFASGLERAGFGVECLDPSEIRSLGLDQEQLCLKYRVLVLPGGATYSNTIYPGKSLAVEIEHSLNWNLKSYAERGNLVLGVDTGFLTLLHLKVFGEDYAYLSDGASCSGESWIKVFPSGNRCVWLKGLGTLELPLTRTQDRFQIDPGSYVEAQGRLERLGMACLKEESTQNIMGLCDQTGRILGMLPHPELFLSWTEYPDWGLASSRASAPGLGFSIFENAARYCAQ